MDGEKFFLLIMGITCNYKEERDISFALNLHFGPHFGVHFNAQKKFFLLTREREGVKDFIENIETLQDLLPNF